MTRRNKGNTVQAASLWMEAPIENDTMISHMKEHGVFAEAEQLMDRLDDGTDDSETLTAAEVRTRLAPYLR
jgi:hypothetical protein